MKHNNFTGNDSTKAFSATQHLDAHLDARHSNILSINRSVGAVESYSQMIVKERGDTFRLWVVTRSPRVLS